MLWLISVYLENKCFVGSQCSHFFLSFTVLTYQSQNSKSQLAQLCLHPHTKHTQTHSQNPPTCQVLHQVTRETCRLQSGRSNCVSSCQCAAGLPHPNNLISAPDCWERFAILGSVLNLCSPEIPITPGIHFYRRKNQSEGRSVSTHTYSIQSTSKNPLLDKIKPAQLHSDIKSKYISV